MIFEIDKKNNLPLNIYRKNHDREVQLDRKKLSSRTSDATQAVGSHPTSSNTHLLGKDPSCFVQDCRYGKLLLR